MKITADVDIGAYQKQIAAVSGVVKKTINQATRQEMGLLTRRLIDLTPPSTSKGATLQAKKLGEGAVARDVKKAFFPVRGRVPLAAAWYESQRNSRGRIGRIPARNKRPANYAYMAAFTKIKQGHVGRAKAGWLAGLLRFGGKGVPQWVRRHGTGQGDSMDTLTMFGGYVEVSNSSKAIAGQDSEARIVDTAISGRIRDMETRMNLILSARLAKAA